MMTKTLLISAIALALSVSGPQALAKKSKRVSSSSSSSTDTSKSADKDKATENKTEAPTNNTANNTQPAAAAPEQKSGGMGTAIAAGVGGAVIGGLAGAAIASSLSGDDEKKDASGNTVSAPIPSPLLKMTPEEAVKSATEMQEKAKEAGFSFAKSDEMLKKTEELIAKDDAGKKQAHEIAVIVHAWAESGVKKSEALKKVSEKLGI
jgi:hypothetical protein